MERDDLKITPLPVGAEVSAPAGFEAHEGSRRALYDAWLEYGFLLFRNVDSIENHLAVSGVFGELELHPMPEIRSDLNPFLISIGGAKRSVAYVYDGEDMRMNRLPWHRDTAYTPEICKGAMLRMVEVPEHDGETMLADTARAYDDLPAADKRRLEGLEYEATLRIGPVTQSGAGAFWKTVRRASFEEDPENPPSEVRPEVIARYPSVIHPAVLKHPESGRKCIFLSPTYVDRFIGMGQQESDEYLAYLTAHLLQPRYIYKHKWAVNDAIIWDNRRCMHAGMGNRLNEPRWGLRTTLAGPLRTGRLLDEAHATSGLTPHLAD